MSMSFEIRYSSTTSISTKYSGPNREICPILFPIFYVIEVDEIINEQFCLIESMYRNKPNITYLFTYLLTCLLICLIRWNVLRRVLSCQTLYSLSRSIILWSKWTLVVCVHFLWMTLLLCTILPLSIQENYNIMSTDLRNWPLEMGLSFPRIRPLPCIFVPIKMHGSCFEIG